MGADTGNGNEKFEIFGGAAGNAMNVDIAFRSKSEAEKWGTTHFKTNHYEMIN